MSIPLQMDETRFHSVAEYEGDSTMHATMESSVSSITPHSMTVMADVHSPPLRAPKHSTPMSGIHGIRPLRNSLRREVKFSSIEEEEEVRRHNESVDAEIAAMAAWQQQVYRPRLPTPPLSPLMTTSGYMKPDTTNRLGQEEEQIQIGSELMEAENRRGEERGELQLGQRDQVATAQLHPFLGMLGGIMTNMLGSNRVAQMPMPMPQQRQGDVWSSTGFSPALDFSPNISPHLTYAPINICYNDAAPADRRENGGGRGRGGDVAGSVTSSRAMPAASRQPDAAHAASADATPEPDATPTLTPENASALPSDSVRQGASIDAIRTAQPDCPYISEPPGASVSRPSPPWWYSPQAERLWVKLVNAYICTLVMSPLIILATFYSLDRWFWN